MTGGTLPVRSRYISKYMKRKYLLDSNICIYLLRNKYGVMQRILREGWSNCCISEITVAEFLYGAENSDNPERNVQLVNSFCSDMEVLPISNIISLYANQKSLLKKQGTLIDDMDLFIGCTAIGYNLVMVTENVKHLSRLKGINVENWVIREKNG